MVEFCIKDTEKKEAAHATKNLVELYESYMLGDPVPPVVWEAATSHTERSSAEDKALPIRLRVGAINIVSSSLVHRETANGGKIKSFPYGPSVLFDTPHSRWFLDMLRELIVNASGAQSGKGLAVVVDTSPGYSGLRPAVEDWLTDIGPERAKVLMVNGVDHQDVVAGVFGLTDLVKRFRDKCGAARSYQSAKAGKEVGEQSKEDERFFLRLCDADTNMVGKNIDDPQRKLGGLEYYLNSNDKTGKVASHDSDDWVGVLYNLVPAQIISGAYKYNWDQFIHECGKEGSPSRAMAERCAQQFKVQRVPYKDEYALQYVADRLSPVEQSEQVKRRPRRVTPAADSLNYSSELKLVERLDTETVFQASHSILEYVRRTDNLYLQATRSAKERIAASKEPYVIQWANYVPSWLFSRFLSCDPKEPPYHHLFEESSHERFIRAFKVLEFCAPSVIPRCTDWFAKLQKKNKYASNSLAVHMLASVLAAHSIKRSMMGKRVLPNCPKPSLFLLKRLVLMMLSVEESRPQVPTQAATISGEFWRELLQSPQNITKAARLVMRRSTNLLPENRPLASRLSSEWTELSRGQLSLVAAHADLKLVYAALDTLNTWRNSDAMALMVDRILHSALVLREMPIETANSYLESVFPKGRQSDDGSDPLSFLRKLEIMKEFEDVLKPILSGRRWNLL